MSTPPDVVEHTVRSGEVSLSVREHGPHRHGDAPTVVAVHGFPDTQEMWGPVVERLVEHAHVVTYDVRGAGASTPPSSTEGYRTARLVDDLVAVRDAVAPTGAIHLLGHDWGSVQLWDVVTSERTDPRLTDRLASFFSISGPSLDHVGAFLRRSRRNGQVREALRQARHSWYVAAFQVPRVPELVFARAGGRLQASLARSQRLGDAPHWAPTFATDGANGVGLYRANVPGRARRPRPMTTQVPVHLLVPEHDAFLTPPVYAHLDRYVSDLTRTDVKAGHWVPRTHPDLVAEQVLEHVRRHERP